MAERIAYAEWALVLRARELFHADSEHLQERKAVDSAIDALYILRATTLRDGRNEKGEVMKLSPQDATKHLGGSPPPPALPNLREICRPGDLQNR